LTRDRRGHEHTFLMHQESSGQRPRVIYWYRTAPAITMGRPPLDEEAIRTIEEQHPEIDFDWPAILALREVMTPEEESRPERQPRRPKPGRGARGPREAASPSAVEPSVEDGGPADELEEESAEDAVEDADAPVAPPTTFGLLDQLVGREISTRLRARHAEVLSRIHAHRTDDPRVPGWTSRAEALDPDTWLTPDAVLNGVQQADTLYDALRRELHDATP
jgi:hypothetical protein